MKVGITRPAFTGLAAIVAIVLCLVTASFANEGIFVGGCVLGTVVIICSGRMIVKRCTGHGQTKRLEVRRGHTTLINSEPLTSIANFDCTDKGPRVIEVEVQDSQERVSQWLKAAPRHLHVVREILHDYDRLAKAAHETEQENEQLRGTVTGLIVRLKSLERDRERLQQEVSRRQAELARYREDGEEITGALTEVNERVDCLKRTLDQAYHRAFGVNRRVKSPCG